MREQIARWLRTYKLGEVEVNNPTIENDGIAPWDKTTQIIRDFWLTDAKELLAQISEEIEKVENPFLYDGENLGELFQAAAFDNCRQAILKALEV